MSYEIINRKFNIEACNLEDITADIAFEFFNKYDKGFTLGSLVALCKDDGTVILNKDHVNYLYYRKLTPLYLAANEKARREVKEMAKELFTAIFDILDDAIKIRMTQDMMRVLELGRRTEREYRR